VAIRLPPFIAATRRFAVAAKEPEDFHFKLDPKPHGLMKSAYLLIFVQLSRHKNRKTIQQTFQILPILERNLNSETLRVPHWRQF
jgi:hypothetical protein